MHDFSAGDVDRSAQIAVEKIKTLAGRATGFGTKILMFAVLTCGIGFLLGLAAFGRDSVGWWLVGGFGVVVGVGSALLGRWRLGSVKRHVPELVGEVRTLLTDGHQAGNQFVEVFIVDDADRGAGTGIELTRTLWSYKGIVNTGTQSFGRLTSAITALTTYPMLAVLAVLTGLGFCGLSLIFLLVIAF